MPDSGTLTRRVFPGSILWKAARWRIRTGGFTCTVLWKKRRAAIRQITYIVLFMILVCILLVSCTSAGLSRLVVHPLEQLSSYIAKVESGNYEFTITSDSTDEVGRLIEAFRKMTANLNHLVNEVLRAKIASRNMS